MKCLIIDGGSGYYSINGTDRFEIDKITKEAIIQILDNIISGKVELDPYIEEQVQNPAQKIIYHNLYLQFQNLSLHKDKFADESAALYQDAKNKYSQQMTAEE